MDQFGAFLGPLFVFAVLSYNKGTELRGYQLAFGLLGIFAIMTLVILVFAKFKYPHPETFEQKTSKKTFKSQKAFMLYMVSVVIIALGFMDYPILAFHMRQETLINVTYIPLLYALAMGIDAIAALIFGHLYDKLGITSLMISVGISLCIAPVFFLVHGVLGLVLGVILWGIGMGAQESILKAVVSQLVSKEKRGTAYGIFYSVFGSAWFIGSMIIGLLYHVNILTLISFTILMQLAAMFTLMLYKHNHQIQT